MMQNVKAGYIDSYTAAAGNIGTKGTAKSSSKSFDDVITGSLKASKPDNTSSTDAAKPANGTDTNKASQDVKAKQNDSQAKPGSGTAETTAPVKTDNTKTTDNTSQQASQVQDKDTPQQENAVTDLTGKVVDISNINIKELLNAIKDSIKQKLGLSEDDLNKALESLGFTPLSLLDVNNLKQFLLKVSNNDDMSAFLTNEDLGNTLKELIKVCDTVQEQFSVSKEQLPVLTQAAVMTAENKTFKDVQTDTDPDVKSTAQPDDKIDITVVKSVRPADTHSSEDSKADKQKTEQNLSATELLIHNLAVNSGEEDGIFTSQLSKAQQIREITSQILDAVRINIKPDQTSMELQLNPENLGRINLTVVSKEGVLTAKFVTGTETAKEAIESQLQVFKENLNNQGLKVENVEVTVSYSAFDQKEQGFQENGGKDSQEKGRNRAFRGLDEINGNSADTSKEELANLGSLEQSTSSVDYTA